MHPKIFHGSGLPACAPTPGYSAAGPAAEAIGQEEDALLITTRAENNQSPWQILACLRARRSNRPGSPGLAGSALPLSRFEAPPATAPPLGQERAAFPEPVWFASGACEAGDYPVSTRAGAAAGSASHEQLRALLQSEEVEEEGDVDWFLPAATSGFAFHPCATAATQVPAPTRSPASPPEGATAQRAWKNSELVAAFRAARLARGGATAAPNTPDIQPLMQLFGDWLDRRCCQLSGLLLRTDSTLDDLAMMFCTSHAIADADALRLRGGLLDMQRYYLASSGSRPPGMSA